MSTMTTTPPSLLQVLSDTVLSPTPSRRRLAARRYEDLTRYLEKHMSKALGCTVWVYAQGSWALGTTLVEHATGKFDLDIVISLDMAKTDLTQRELVQMMHGWLVNYYTTGHGGGDLKPDDYEKGKRAFTLLYDDHFHIDVLAVVIEKPEPPCLGQPSWLTDRDLAHWQPTNPKGWVEHFRQVAAAERTMLAKRAEVAVEELEWIGVNTQLQRAVLLFKQHRNVLFDDDPDDLAPHSSLITAMAAGAYAESSALEPRLGDIVSGMREQIRFLDRQLWVPNPTWKRNGRELENYADRYKDRPDKVDALRRWVAELEQMFARYEGATGLRERAAELSKSFGEGLGQAAAAAAGQATGRLAQSGRLGVTATGLSTAGRPYPDSTFHGDGH